MVRDKGLDALSGPVNHHPLITIENLWLILKKQIRARRSSNIHPLKAIAKEEWEKILSNIFQNLVRNYSSCLAAVIEPK